MEDVVRRHSAQSDLPDFNGVLLADNSSNLFVFVFLLSGFGALLEQHLCIVVAAEATGAVVVILFVLFRVGNWVFIGSVLNGLHELERNSLVLDLCFGLGRVALRLHLNANFHFQVEQIGAHAENGMAGLICHLDHLLPRFQIFVGFPTFVRYAFGVKAVEPGVDILVIHIVSEGDHLAYARPHGAEATVGSQNIHPFELVEADTVFREDLWILAQTFVKFVPLLRHLFVAFRGVLK